MINLGYKNLVKTRFFKNQNFINILIYQIVSNRSN